MAGTKKKRIKRSRKPTTKSRSRSKSRTQKSRTQKSRTKSRSKSKKPMKDDEFYSLTLKKKVTCYDDEICLKKMKNGRYALIAKCPKSGNPLYKFVKTDNVEKLRKKFGKCKK